MIFKDYSKLKGTHALFSPSQPYWLNYNDEKIFDKFVSSYAQYLGTSLHEIAEGCISTKWKLIKTDKRMIMKRLTDPSNDICKGYAIPAEAIDIDRIFPNLMNYVNDAIGFRMTPEVILRYSEYCYGTADAIGFDEKKSILRIHDFKSGISEPKMQQLICYAALYCLDYDVKPSDIDIRLGIYWNSQIITHNPTPEEIVPVMDKMISVTKRMNRIRGLEV